MRKILIQFTFMLMMLSVGCASAQPQINSGTSNKKAKALYEEASRAFGYREYGQALQMVEAAIAKDAKYIDAWDLKSDILYHLDKGEEAYTAAEQCIKIDDQYFKGYFVLAELAQKLGRYEDAIKNADKFISFKDMPDAQKRFITNIKYKSQYAIDQMQHPVDFTPVNLGPNINTKDKEYAPSLTVDNKTLIFSRNAGRQEDFYISTRKGYDWQSAIKPTYPLNTPENESFPSFTADGKYVFFARFITNEPGNCDIWFSQKTEVGWDEPRNIGPPINTSGWESQPCISADGSTLYFLAIKKGSLNSDIYRSKYIPGSPGKPGRWDTPVNLGPAINSDGNEEAPFIHPDGKTFYFSSDGRPGLGAFDLYYSTMNDDGTFTEAQGLGYPINTKDDERWITVSSNGIDAYFVSSGHKGYGDWDIFNFKLPQSKRPDIVTYVKGRVFDQLTKEPIRARIEVTDLQTKKVKYITVSNKSSGEMLACLVSGGSYAFQISAEGYGMVSENYTFTLAAGIDSPILKDFYLQPLKVGGSFVLRNIFFDIDKADLKAESYLELDKLVDILNKNPKLTLEVGGHTDNTGARSRNVALSESRAKAVYTYLVGKGIAAQRLTTKGYADFKPYINPANRQENTNKTEAERAENRRTEFTITAN